jgi:hypothetical protein
MQAITERKPNATQQRAIDAYILTSRDTELDTWNAMYDALYPRKS